MLPPPDCCPTLSLTVGRLAEELLQNPSNDSEARESHLFLQQTMRSKIPFHTIGRTKIIQHPTEVHGNSCVIMSQEDGEER